MPTLDYRPPGGRDNHPWKVLKRWAIAAAGALAVWAIVQLLIGHGVRSSASPRPGRASMAVASEPFCREDSVR